MNKRALELRNGFLENTVKELQTTVDRLCRLLMWKREIVKEGGG